MQATVGIMQPLAFRGITIKRSVLRMVFARPLGFSRKTGLRTPETTLPFKALRFLSTSDCKMVPIDGIELQLPIDIRLDQPEACEGTYPI